MKTYCRPRWIAAVVVLWLATVATGIAYEFSFWWFVIVWAPYVTATLFTNPRRRLRDRSVLACDCPRHLEAVPVEDRPDWNKDSI